MSFRPPHTLKYADLPEPGAPEILDRYVGFQLAKVRTIAPGRVVSFDREKQTIEVQPLFMTVFVVDGVEDIQTPPVLSGVPVSFPRGGGFVFTWDIVPGDIVTLLFCERSIDSLKKTGQLTDPTPRRKHDPSDAIAITGFSPEVNPIPGMTLGQLRIGLETGEAEVTIDRASGTVTVEGFEVKLGGGASHGVGRVGDSITISPATDPAFFTWLSTLSPTTVTPYTAAITGRIAAGSLKVKAE